MILVLGGTTEARALASLLGSDGTPFISSLAGRVTNPRLPAGEVRIGGFGGVSGLAAYLETHRITAVVDATHPFAARITANAAEACARTGIPLLILSRPEWKPEDDDTWLPARDPEHASHLIERIFPVDAHVLLTTGRQDAAAFANLPNPIWLRAIERPVPPLPRHCEILLDRGPFALDAERNLLDEKRIDLLVTKNSGGAMTAPKLRAARELHLPVVMIDRPALPAGVPIVTAPPEAVAWLTTAP